MTLSGSLSVPSLDVKEGTLVIDTTATFAQATTLTIRSGATVITRQGTTISNVTFVKEDGAVLSLDFTVPYADGATTALDYSALTADGWAGMDKPIPLKLSEPIAHPVNEAMSLAMIKLPSSLGATVADFSDTTAKTYDLPVTSFKIEKGNDGLDVVYLNVRPAVYLAVSSASDGLLEEKQGDSATWTDGLAAHAGVDYVVPNGAWVVTTKGWNSGAWTFPGESLTFAGGTFATKAATNAFKRLAFYGNTTVMPQGYKWYDNVHVIEGECHIAVGTVVTVTATTPVEQGITSRRTFDFAGTLTGSGTLKFSGSSSGLNARISGDGTAFDGAIDNGATGTAVAPALLECVDLNRLLAPRTTVNNSALKASGSYSGFHVTEDCTFADNGFHLMLSGWDSGISVAEAKTLTVMGRMILNSTESCKYGDGTLALAGKMLYGGDGMAKPEQTYAQSSYYFRLCGGWVKPVAWNDGSAYHYTRFVAAAADAGFAFDAEPTDEYIAKYGLRLAYDNSITFADGVDALPIKILLGENGTRVKKRITVPVLTVTDTLAAALEGKLTVVQNFEGGQAEIIRAAVDIEGKSFTTFSVTLRPKGFAVRIK